MQPVAPPTRRVGDGLGESPWSALAPLPAMQGS